MAAFDFPTSPTGGDIYGPYTWDGEKWFSTQGGSGDLPPPPAWANVKLLMGWNGVHGAFAGAAAVDESAAPHSLLSASSTVSLTNAQKVFGPTAFTTAGGVSDAVIFNDSADWSFGTGKYTIEFWLRPTSIPSIMALVLKDGGANNFDIYMNAGVIALRHNSVAVASGGSLSINTWYAICVERGTADKCRIYINGVMVASGTSAANIGTGGLLFIASRNSGNDSLRGYMDELRLVKGEAVYDSDAGYTVRTTAFPRGTPSYSNPGGFGSRTSLITISTTLSVSAGTINDLIDGAYTDVMWIAGSQTGKTLTFDFGAAKTINEFKWYQSSGVSQGTWVFGGSNDNSSFTEFPESFSLGATTPQTNAVTNTTAYRYYRLRSTAGTTSSGPYLEEIEFKIL